MELKKLPHTHIVDRFFPSTKLCPQCGSINKISLSERIYSCECGYTQDRDIHSAMNILIESINNIIPLEQRNFKPVELNTSALSSIEEYVNIDCEAGSYNSLELW